MVKNIAYFWLVLALMFVQIFILNEISLAMWLRPMIFPLVVLLLPFEWKTIWIVITTLLIGIFMDVSLGGAGIYTATLLPTAVMRRWIMFLTTRRSVESGDQTSLLSRMPIRQVMIYTSAMLLLYHALFFSLETLSMTEFWRLIATIVFSTLLSILISWPVVRLFISKIVK